MTKTPLYVACGALTVAAALFFHLGAPAMAPVAAPTLTVVPTPTSAPNTSAIATTASDVPTRTLGTPLVPQSPQVVPAVNPADLPATTNWAQFRPQRLALNTPAGPLTFDTVRTYEENGRTVMQGDTADYPGAHYASAGTADTWSAFLTLPDGNTYAYTVDHGKYTVREINPDEFTCSPTLPTTPAPAAAYPIAADALKWQSGEGVTAQSPATAYPIAADIYYVDVLLVYDAALLAGKAISVEALTTEFTAAIATANNYLTASQISNMQWRAAGCMQMTPYTATEDMENDLSKVSTDPAVAQKRADVGADQVHLALGSVRQYAGLAYRPTSPTATSAFSVGTDITPSIMAHEMGHNFGCRHDHKEQKTEGSTDYPYGHRFDNNGADTGTIMSYAGTRLLYFSNPDLSYNGHALGIAAGQPDAADNARKIREGAAAMANLFTSPGSGLTTAGFHYTEDGAGITITGYTGPGAVTVPASISGKPVTTIGVRRSKLALA